MTPTDEVISRLRNAGCNPKQSRVGQWTAKCPNTSGHRNGDRHPSLSIADGTAGCVLHCATGCPPADVAAALGLRMHQLFDTPPDPAVEPRIAARHPYVDAEGTLLFEVVRWEPKRFQQRRPDGHGGWMWNLQGVDRPLYRLPAVLQAVQDGAPIWIVEGEKDVDTLAALGLVATCNPMGAGKWRPEHTATLHGATVVNIVADNDTAGHDHAAAVAAALTPHTTVRLWHPPAGRRDVTDHLNRGGTLEQLVEQTTGDDQAVAVEPEDDPTRNWKPADLAAAYARGLTRPEPSILLRTDGKHLLYPGRTHTIFGESGAGKTWVAYIAAVQLIRQGEHVIVIDFEDDENAYIARLLALGLPIDLIVANTTYYPVGLGALPGDLEDMDRLIVERGTALVVVDSTGEALAAQGLDQDKDPDVARWMSSLPRRWAKLGPCVLMLDHMPHAGGREIGSQRKRAGISGAAYEAIAAEPFARDRAGSLLLKVAKDRGGNFAKGTEQALVRFEPADDGAVMVATVAPGSGRTVSARQRSLGDYMDAVVELLGAAGGAVKARDLRAGIAGDNKAVDLAVRALEASGRVAHGREGYQLVERPVDK